VIITNDLGSTRLYDKAPEVAASRWYTELLSPVAALWNTRVARGSQAQRALGDAAAGFRRDPLDKDCAGNRTRSSFRSPVRSG